jgi:alpha-amylase
LNSHLQYIQDNYPLSQYSTFLTNHDQNRIYSELNRTDWMKLASTIYLTLPGIPFVYYGEEIALTGVGDHLNIRTPMQWSGSNNAGFSTRTPWKSFAQDFKVNNVELQQQSDASIWSHYQRIIELRNSETSLQEGVYWPIKTNHSGLFAYARTHGKISPHQYLLMLHNLGDTSIQRVGRTSQTLLKPGTRYIENALTGDDMGESCVG